MKKKPASLPKEFVQTVGALFQKQFAKQLGGSTFLIFGDLYPDEAVLGVSLTHPKSLQAASLHISSDLPKNIADHPEKVTERLKSMVDVAASWFSQCFEAGPGLETVLNEMTDANPDWQELEWEGLALFVKLNRTNYTLEKAADDLLKKSGFSEEGEDLLDGDDEEVPDKDKLH